MMTVAVVLREYERQEIELDHDAVTALQAAAGRALSIAPTDDPERWNIQAGCLVGTVVTPSAKVLIRPKVSAANLFHLLEAGRDPLQVGTEIYDYDASSDLVPAFATFFVRHLERALVRGLVRRYTEKEEQLAGIRGRVDLRAQVRSGGLPLPAHCRFDEHSGNTQLNRLLAGAVNRLRKFPGVTNPTRRALLQLSGAFDEASRFTPSDLDRPTTFSRLDRHFEPAERLSRLVLTGSSLVDSAGQTAAGTFLVDMNKVFESFVESRLRRCMRGRAEVRGQGSTVLDHDGHVRMRPDLMIRRQGADSYVADTKYKLTADGFGRESDYYQLLAYCTALGLPEGMLIYCHHDGTLPTREVHVRGGFDRRLVTSAIRLDGTPADLDQRLAELADVIHLRAAAVSTGPLETE